MAALARPGSGSVGAPALQPACSVHRVGVPRLLPQPQPNAQSVAAVRKCNPTQGAQCFLGMLHGESPDGGAAKSEDAPAGPPAGGEAGLPLPPGAFGGRGLAGASFNSVLPSLLMAVGGAPKEAGELTSSEPLHARACTVRSGRG